MPTSSPKNDVFLAPIHLEKNTIKYDKLLN